MRSSTNTTSTATPKACASGSIRTTAGRHFRLLLIDYFEGLDAERAIAWRAADSFALREFLGLVLPEAPPDHSTISRTRRLIDLETHEAVVTWMLQRLADAGLGSARGAPAESVSEGPLNYCQRRANI